MNNQLQALDKSIEQYKAIQKKHIREFETSLLPDIESQNFERKHAFAEMKNQFDELLKRTQYNRTEIEFNYIEAVAAYISEINKILKFDSILKNKIIKYKKELKQHLTNTGKIRTAFNGYAASTDTYRYTAIKLTS